MRNEIWKYFGDTYKAHCKSPADAKRMMKWTGVEWGGDYHFPDGGFEMDIIFPTKLYNRVASILGLTVKKSPKFGYCETAT